MLRPVNLKRGDDVILKCPKEGCDGARIDAVLGEDMGEAEEFLDQRMVGRFKINSRSKLKKFSLEVERGGSGPCQCPKCFTLFTRAIIVYHVAHRPLIFGYPDSKKEPQAA